MVRTLNMIRTMKKTIGALVSAFAVVSGAALAAGGGDAVLKHEHWHFTGPFGSFDKEAVQRGYQVYRTVCAGCHSMDQLAFRNLGQKGGPFYLERCPEGVPETVDCSNPNDNPYVKQIASEFSITDGPDDFGDMFQRPGLPSDGFPTPYPNEQIARLANGGAYPPDLSLITKARPNGADYLYSLLTGYEDTPPSLNVAPGQYYNVSYPGDTSQILKPEYKDADGHVVEGFELPKGGVFAMPKPLADGVVDYEQEDIPETVDQYSKDVTEFLMWAAEPKLEARKRLGVMSLGYLIILTGILYWSTREIWSKAK
ncbi:MAG: cytochrome c1 [Pseudomonadota bacterium]